MSNVTNVEKPSLSSGRAAGIAVGTASVLTVVLMMYHPTVHAHSPAELVAQLVESAWVNAVVHGVFLAQLSVLGAGFSLWSSRLDPHGFVVRLALSAYLIGAVAMMAATTVDGFITPEFAARYQGRPAEELEFMRHGLHLAWAVNQVCSRVGVLAMSVAVLLWSLPLLRRGLSIIGGLGLLAGGGPALALLFGALRMDVHGMLAFVAAQMVWGLSVAWLLVRGRV
jgi:hypothetical protein